MASMECFVPPCDIFLFCQTTFIPKGTLFMPPDNNVVDRPWKPDGKYSDDDQSSPYTGSGLTSSEMEEMRSQFERMYGDGGKK
jgi:hypothetical protein